MTVRKLLILFIFTGIAAFYSCDHKRVFETYNPVPQGRWQKDSAFSYSFEIKDALLSYNLTMNLRNSVDYPYSNIWMFITIAPHDGIAQTDTVEFALADPSGKWLGKGYGKFRDNTLPYRSNFYFPKPGPYNFTIRHGMRNDVLEGISDVGFRVEKTR